MLLLGPHTERSTENTVYPIGHQADNNVNHNFHEPSVLSGFWKTLWVFWSGFVF